MNRESRPSVLARQARETGLLCVLDSGPDAEGPASLGALITNELTLRSTKTANLAV